jgi:hypothetical protein
VGEIGRISLWAFLEEWRTIDHAALKAKGLFHILEHTRSRCMPHDHNHIEDIHHYSANPYESYCETCQLVDFSEIIRDFCRNDCKEPHDSVYGLIGLFEEAGCPWVYRMNYRQSPKDLFIDLVAGLFIMLKRSKFWVSCLNVTTGTTIANLATAMDIRVVNGTQHDRIVKVRDLKARRLPESELKILDANDNIRKRPKVYFLLERMWFSYYNARYDDRSERSLRQELRKHLVWDGVLTV